MLIRPEQPVDLAGIGEIHRRAFGRDEEADLVDRLRAASDVDPALSLVAEHDGALVGHVLFPRIEIRADAPPSPAIERSETGLQTPALALAPMAVVPEYQRRGVGTALVQEGLSACRKRGHGVVVVLGHPEYYPRFGFQPASRFEIRAPIAVPDDAFMVLALSPAALEGVRGVVRYPPAFGIA